MVLVEPNVILNSIMGKLYNVLTNGDETVPMSEDNFFSWATPGIPIEPSDFEFLSQGLTGIVKKAKLDEIRGGSENKGGSENTSNQPEITPQMLEQLRAQDTAGLYMQAENFARLVDFVPDMAKPTNNQFARLSIMNNEGTLSERYEYILRMSQIMQTELDEETKKKIEKFRGLLSVTKIKKNLIDDTETTVTEPSPLVQVYNEKLKNYEDAVLEYNNRRIEGLTADDVRAVHFWAMNANTLRNRVKSAMSDWVGNGYKNEYEQIAAFIDHVTQRDMSLLKQQYREDLEKARLTGLASGSDFYYSSLVPGNFMKASGWTEFTFNSCDFNSSSNNHYSSSSSWGGGGASFLGLFGGGGRHTESEGYNQSNAQFDGGNFSMKFWMTQVPIVRPWYKTAFLNSKLWRFDQNNPEAKDEVVSDGVNPPKGLIPAYPTSLIVIKDLELVLWKSSGISEFISSYESSSTGGSGFISLGPFHLGGYGGHSSSSGQASRSYNYNHEAQTMKVPGAQIIGFKCHVMPKSPDPLSSITKWI